MSETGAGNAKIERLLLFFRILISKPNHIEHPYPGYPLSAVKIYSPPYYVPPEPNEL
jgi:hypothetical protein